MRKTARLLPLIAALLLGTSPARAADGARQILDDPSDQDPVHIRPARPARGNAPETPVQSHADGSQIVKIRGAWGDYCLRTPAVLPVGGSNPFGPELAVASNCPR